jgi:hypothetical protein
VYCSQTALVTLWGEHARAFDAAGLREMSNDEPVIVMFVGMSIGQYLGISFSCCHDLRNCDLYCVCLWLSYVNIYRVLVFWQYFCH